MGKGSRSCCSYPGLLSGKATNGRRNVYMQLGTCSTSSRTLRQTQDDLRKLVMEHLNLLDPTW